MTEILLILLKSFLLTLLVAPVAIYWIWIMRVVDVGEDAPILIEITRKPLKWSGTKRVFIKGVCVERKA